MMGMKMPPARAVVEGMAGAMHASATVGRVGGGSGGESARQQGEASGRAGRDALLAPHSSTPHACHVMSLPHRRART